MPYNVCIHKPLLTMVACIIFLGGGGGRKLPLCPPPENILISFFFSFFLRKLNHSHIITLLAFSLTHEELILVTNYVDGKNLDTVIFSKDYVKDVRNSFMQLKNSSFACSYLRLWLEILHLKLLTLFIICIQMIPLLSIKT